MLLAHISTSRKILFAVPCIDRRCEISGLLVFLYCMEVSCMSR